MTRTANDNDVAVPGCLVRPRVGRGSCGDTIGMEVQTPLTDQRLALALETLEEGLSVLVIGPTHDEVDDAVGLLTRDSAAGVVP